MGGWGWGGTVAGYRRSTWGVTHSTSVPPRVMLCNLCGPIIHGLCLCFKTSSLWRSLWRMEVTGREDNTAQMLSTLSVSFAQMWVFCVTELSFALKLWFPVSCQASVCHPFMWVRTSHNWGCGRPRDGPAQCSQFWLHFRNTWVCVNTSNAQDCTQSLLSQLRWVVNTHTLTVQPGWEPLFCRKYYRIDQSACRQNRVRKYSRDVSGSELIQILCYFPRFCDVQDIWFLFEICKFVILFSHSTQLFTFAPNFVFFFSKRDSQDSMSFMPQNIWGLLLV